jgi:hypothetical protein
MRVGRKSAFVLLAIVVLWAATPALACLTPPAHRSCCQGTMMRDCDSPAAMQCGDCCSVQPADAPLLPVPANAVDHAVGSVTAAAPAALVLLPAAGSAIVHTIETPHPPGSPGAGSVLRI